MEIKWERNTRALALAAQGKIKGEDILPRSKTEEFPTETATVRMRQLSHQFPHVTVHIRGKAASKSTWNGRTYEYAPTCRVNFGGEWQGKQNTSMDSNGDLAENMTWLDVHNVVTEVKEAMEI